MRYITKIAGTVVCTASIAALSTSALAPVEAAPLAASGSQSSAPSWLSEAGGDVTHLLERYFSWMDSKYWQSASAATSLAPAVKAEPVVDDDLLDDSDDTDGEEIETSTSASSVPVAGAVTKAVTTSTTGYTPVAGIPAGTALKPHYGNIYIDTPGTVIENKDVHGSIVVRASNVTIRKCRVRGMANPAYSTGAVVNRSGLNLNIQDSEIAPTTPHVLLDGFHGSNANLTRVDIHHTTDGVKIFGAGNVNVTNSHVHDLVHHAYDPTQRGGASHNDSVQILGGKNIAVRNSRLTGGANAAVQVTQDNAPVSNITFTGNFMDSVGLTWPININSKGRTTPITGINVANNRFGRAHTRGSEVISNQPGTFTSNYFFDGATAKISVYR